MKLLETLTRNTELAVRLDIKREIESQYTAMKRTSDAARFGDSGKGKGKGKGHFQRPPQFQEFDRRYDDSMKWDEDLKPGEYDDHDTLPGEATELDPRTIPDTWFGDQEMRPSPRRRSKDIPRQDWDQSQTTQVAVSSTGRSRTPRRCWNAVESMEDTEIQGPDCSKCGRPGELSMSVRIKEQGFLEKDLFALFAAPVP